MRRILIIASAALCSLLLVGCGAEQAVKKADKFYALGEYYDAATQYKKAYSQTPAKEKVKRGQLSAKMADCYRRINNTTKAITAYKNVIRNKQADSLTHLRLAQQLMKNGSYKEAEKNFQEAIDSISKERGSEGDSQQGNDRKTPILQNSLDKKQLISLAKNGLKAAQQAPQWKKEGSQYTVKRMDLFNSRRDDYSPALAGDENEQLFFTSTRNQAQGDEYSGITGSKAADIFFSQKDDKGKWSKPQAIDSELNSIFDEGACCFSPDSKTMYLTQCATDPSYPRYATIVVSSRSDAAWSKPKELVVSKDTLSSFAHPAVSPDGEWLYFVSDMPGGVGGLDIWRCRLYGNNETVGIENLGEPINTPGDEMFPTFRPNGDLYFSSNGHPGLGGLDIFIVHGMSNETRNEKLEMKNEDYHAGPNIEHPGFPLNSQGDDFGMTFEGLLNKGFFSSSRGDNRGMDHIYSFFNPEIVQTVKGWVYEQDGYELTAAQVYMVGNDGTNLKLSVRGDGSFTQEIKPNVDYVFLGTCKGFLNHQEQLRVEPVKESEEYVLQFPLANISAPVLIENIFYDFDKATLRPESATALDELVKLLNDNPHVTIELSAHTDYKGSDQYNERLSQRRAESVVRYLIEHGIAADRLTPKGYGEGKPKTIKKKVAERYPFLKEGDVLTEDYIATLPEDQQEQCNQLNRRTEFIVLRTTYGMFDTEGKLIQKPQAAAPPQDSEEPQSSELW
jgi:outer membrane protein OmpA-like peptidoglycan-associated protein/tetratricopeptide (TPR) repeat protein